MHSQTYNNDDRSTFAATDRRLAWPYSVRGSGACLLLQDDESLAAVAVALLLYGCLLGKQRQHHIIAMSSPYLTCD